jgi:transcriptional regulator with XRE-family HTH domain
VFYVRFTMLCAEKGVSPSKAALDNGISKTSVTRWKGGATPNADILTSLATYFDTSVDYLLAKTDIKKPADRIDGFVPTQAEKDFIINVYRKLSPEQQEAFRTILRKEK